MKLITFFVMMKYFTSPDGTATPKVPVPEIGDTMAYEKEYVVESGFLGQNGNLLIYYILPNPKQQCYFYVFKDINVTGAVCKGRVE